MSESARYPVPARPVRGERVVRRSRFVVSIAPAASVEQAEAFIAGVAAELPDATHHCWAYLVGPPGSTARCGMSDAGEPHGTAGRPMLHVLQHARVGDVVAVVSRWFGGTQLGRGGLVRAYGGILQEILAGAPRAEKVRWIALRLELAYADHEAARRVLASHGAPIDDEAFGARVEVRLRVAEDRLAALRAALAEQLAGRAHLEVG